MKTLQELAESLANPAFAQMALVKNTAGIYSLSVVILPEDPGEGFRAERHLYFIREATGDLIKIEPMSQEAADAALAEALKPV